MRRLMRDSGGGVSILGAFSLVGLIGMMGFVVDGAAAYSAKIRNQRVSDMAALSAAQVLNDTGSSTAMQAAAEGVAAAAGLADADVDAERIGTDEVEVTVTTDEGTYFARIFGAETLGVSSQSVAKFGNIVPACIVALAEGAPDGILGTGGITLNAAGCAVASNSQIRAIEGAKLSAMSFTTPNGTVVECDPIKGRSACGARIETAPSLNQFSSGSVQDPLAGNQALQTALSALAAGEAPAFPAVNTGKNLVMPNNWGGELIHEGYKATWANNTYTFPPGNYEFTDLRVPDGMKFVFDGPNTRVTVSNNVTVGGGSGLTIRDGDVIMKKALNIGGGTTVTFGNGSHAVGSVNVGGGSTLDIGNGPLYVDGSLTTGGGSTLKIGAAGAGKSHFINGHMSLSGNATLGQGRYAINGDFSNHTGGAIRGNNVNVLAKGKLTLGGGTNIEMSAPTIDSDNLIADLLFASLTTTETWIGAGARNQYKGAIYVPRSPVRLDGGGSLTASNGCFTLIASTIRLNGGATSATACPNIGAGASGVLVALVR